VVTIGQKSHRQIIVLARRQFDGLAAQHRKSAGA
jgi:hypothetical protein